MNIARNTTLRTDKKTGNHVVRFWETDILEWSLFFIALDHGGYKTSITKRRLNQISEAFGLGFRVFQKNHTWFVEYNDEIIEFEKPLKLHRWKPQHAKTHKIGD